MTTPSSILPGRAHEQRNLVGCSSWGCKRVGHYLGAKQQQKHYFSFKKKKKNCLHNLKTQGQTYHTQNVIQNVTCSSQVNSWEESDDDSVPLLTDSFVWPIPRQG